MPLDGAADWSTDTKKNNKFEKDAQIVISWAKFYYGVDSLGEDETW